MDANTIDLCVAQLELIRIGIAYSRNKEKPTAYFYHYRIPWDDNENDVVKLKIEGQDSRVFKRALPAVVPLIPMPDYKGESRSTGKEEPTALFWHREITRNGDQHDVVVLEIEDQEPRVYEQISAPELIAHVGVAPEARKRT